MRSGPKDPVHARDRRHRGEFEPSARRAAERGMTLVEVVAGLGLFSLVLVAVASGLQAASRVAREAKTDILIHHRASNIVALVSSLRFGLESDPDPLAEQLDELFDGDIDPGDVTLRQLLRAPAGADGWVFELDDELDGSWRVQVGHDVDDDGVVGTATTAATIDGARRLADVETAGTTIVIEVFFEGTRVLRSIRTEERNS